MRKTRQRGFTLVELLMVMSIIAILSTIGMLVYRGAEEDAMKSRTQSQIERIQKVLDQKFEEYTYRILPIRWQTPHPVDINRVRVRGMAELMRVEMPSLPEHVDPATFPVNQFVRGGVTGTVDSRMPSDPTRPPDFDWLTMFPAPQMMARYQSYFSQFPATWIATNGQAELLYATLLLSYDDSGQTLLEVLRESEVQDTDNDGAPEVIDAFGTPLVYAIAEDADGDGVFSSIDPSKNDPTKTSSPIDDIPIPIEKLRIIISSTNLAGRL